jgi:hypothetical protein
LDHYVYVRCWPGFTDEFDSTEFDLLDDEVIGPALQQRAIELRAKNADAINESVARHRKKVEDQLAANRATSIERPNTRPFFGNPYIFAVATLAEDVLRRAAKNQSPPVKTSGARKKKARQKPTDADDRPPSIYKDGYAPKVIAPPEPVPHWIWSPDGRPTKGMRAPLICSVGFHLGFVRSFAGVFGGSAVGPLTFLAKMPDEASAQALCLEIEQDLKNEDNFRHLCPRFRIVPVNKYSEVEQLRIERRILGANGDNRVGMFPELMKRIAVAVGKAAAEFKQIRECSHDEQPDSSDGPAAAGLEVANEVAAKAPSTSPADTQLPQHDAAKMKDALHGLPFSHSDGYGSLTVGPDTFYFTETQRICVKKLVTAFKNGSPAVTLGDLLAAVDDELGGNPQKIYQIFRGHPAWGVLIVPVPNKQGLYRLNVAMPGENFTPVRPPTKKPVVIGKKSARRRVPKKRP